MTFHPTGQTIGNLVPPLTVPNGGTGSATASGARTNLGVAYDAAVADLQPSGAVVAGANGLVADSGHAHPSALFTAADVGLLAWNYDIGVSASGTTPGTGVVNLIRVNIRQAISVTNVVIGVTTAGSGLTSSQNLVGLYNSAGTLLGTSADQTAAWGSSGLKTAAIGGGPFALSAGTFVWVAVVSNTGTTTPSLCRTGVLQSGCMNVGFTAATARWASNGTATTAFATPITPASNTLTGTGYWAGLS